MFDMFHFYKKEKCKLMFKCLWGFLINTNFELFPLPHGIITKENAFKQQKVMAQSQTLSKCCFSRIQTWLKPVPKSPKRSPSCICSLNLSEVEAEGTDLLFVFVSLKYNLLMKSVLHLEAKHLGFSLGSCQKQGCHPCDTCIRTWAGASSDRWKSVDTVALLLVCQQEGKLMQPLWREIWQSLRRF